jgi:large subunit ribosomal protein L35
MAKIKMKSNRAARKRFRVTAKGKFLRSHANKSHILTKKTRKRKRNLRKQRVVGPTNHDAVRRMLLV